MKAYRELENRFRDMAVLEEVATVLHWDSAVIMPPSAAKQRGEQLGAIRVLSHERLVDPTLGDLLDRAEEDLSGSPDALDAWQKANLSEMRRRSRRAMAVPADLVARLSTTTAQCESVWRRARADADFTMVASDLAEVIKLTREHAGHLSEALDVDPYNALLDGFEPGLTVDGFQPVFEDYIAFMKDVLPEILDRQTRAGSAVRPKGPFPAISQRNLVSSVISAAGFPLGSAGRVDESAHPFSTGYPGDSRITIGVNEQEPLFCLMAAMHECGHALYEIGLPKAWQRQPVGESRGMAMHESQSLIVEMQTCRSPAYASWVSEHLIRYLGDDPAFEPGNLLKLLTHVEPGYIRVDADEVTYPAHVVLRTRLERALLSGDLAVTDLPAAWNDGMRDLLGIVPHDDALGCLQDIHWYDGAFGYFPTYSLGAMMAAQLMQAARRDKPDLDAAIQRGDFSELIGWLRSAIHAAASSLSAQDILRAATGGPLDPSAFKRHIRRRYLDA